MFDPLGSLEPVTHAPLELTQKVCILYKHSYIVGLYILYNKVNPNILGHHHLMYITTQYLFISL